MIYDVAIIGAGIVGLATAFRLLERRPDLSICILEKEREVAVHQTGHNSGVIHSGIYYKPGSLKATNCRRGYEQLIRFCKDYGIDYDLCGKVIVATKEEERPLLDTIYQRGLANGMKGIRKISPEETRETEPHVNVKEAIWVPQAGIIHYADVARQYQKIITQQGADFFFGNKVVDIKREKNGSRIITNTQEVQTRLLISCAGLYADKIADMTGAGRIKILPFRGEYYELKKEKQHLVNNLIYPVPNPAFPFLGVHFTRMIKGGIEAGPNAVLAFKREGYSRWDVDFPELTEILSFRGFRKISSKYWKTGLGELHRSFSKKAFVRALRHLISDINYEDLERGGSGVRAMACDRNGNLIDDFLIQQSPGLIHVINAPSPAATASLSIGETIAKKALSTYAG